MAYGGRWRDRAAVEAQLDAAWLLHTADAHELYRRHGFAEPDATLLERPARVS